MSIERSPLADNIWRPRRSDAVYRGRIAPTPTGLLHLGHARTFWTAHERARDHQGVLIYRNEDLDRARCREEFFISAQEDLRWFGLGWEEGPDRGGPFGPYRQSQRLAIYRETLDRLRAGGFVYPCYCSRRDIAQAVNAPHAADEEPLYPGFCRAGRAEKIPGAPGRAHANPCWRFLVPDGQIVQFEDGARGPQSFVAGRDFGDFVVWSRDDIPSYQLAVVTDDALMGITEVVRGADLLVSTARQILLYRALGWSPPAFYHCPLVTDASGARLAKRDQALSLRQLRQDGVTSERIREKLGELASG